MFNRVGKSFVTFSEVSNELLGSSGMVFREIIVEADLLVLQRLFEEADGVRLPISYLQQGRAFICYDSKLTPQGGFALIERGPFRSITQIPDAGILPFDGLFCELTAVCLSRGGSLRRSRFWSFVVGTALSSPAQNIVYAVDARKTALRKQIFNHIRSSTLYEGPVKKLEGMNEETVEAVEISNKYQLTRGFLKLALRESKNFTLSSLIRQRVDPASTPYMKPHLR